MRSYSIRLKNSSTLMHYGVMGMHWGIRRYQNPDGSLTSEGRSRYSVKFKSQGMSIEEFARASELWRKHKEYPGLTQREKEHVYEEFDNNLSHTEKQMSIVSRPIGNYKYTAIHKGHNQYKIIDRSPKSWLDDVLTEVIGSDWRDYDDED